MHYYISDGSIAAPIQTTGKNPNARERQNNDRHGNPQVGWRNVGAVCGYTLLHFTASLRLLRVRRRMERISRICRDRGPRIGGQSDQPGKRAALPNVFPRRDGECRYRCRTDLRPILGGPRRRQPVLRCVPAVTVASHSDQFSSIPSAGHPFRLGQTGGSLLHVPANGRLRSPRGTGGGQASSDEDAAEDTKLECPSARTEQATGKFFPMARRFVEEARTCALLTLR